jgi:hypothetical protein
MKYAARTSVTPERSRAEIERTLTRYGATGFMYAWSESGATIGFMMNDVQYRVTIPPRQRKNFEKMQGGRRRNNTQIKQAMEQSEKQGWRSLALIIKAKLEWLDDKSHKVEEEFLPWMVMPDGRTFADWAIPQIEVMKASKQMPRLMVSDIKDGDVVDGEVS